jgi:acetylglutamate kinase
MEQDVIAIKIGGKPAGDDATQRIFARELAQLQAGHRIVVIHGGGAEVSRITKTFGLQPVFKDGIRMTSAAEMEIVDMVLAGKVNKEIVRRFQSCGVPAFGFSGADGPLFTGESVDAVAQNRTGHVKKVDRKPLDLLMDGGYVPVIASVSVDDAGNALNINADEAALDVAAALHARSLLFLSDTPGIILDTTVAPQLTEAEIEREIGAGAISGGMIPKARSSIAALKRGVEQIIIGEFNEYGDLARLLDGSQGTRIIL